MIRVGLVLDDEVLAYVRMRQALKLIAERGEDMTFNGLDAALAARDAMADVEKLEARDGA